MADDKKWLTTAQVAKLLKVEPITVWRLANDGKIPFTKTPGGHRRFDPGEIDAYIATLTPPED